MQIIQKQQIAIAVISNHKNQILLTKRKKNAHQGGLWEFPGGKVMPQEIITDALKRECQEELGIEITAQRPLININYQYPELNVELQVFLIENFLGKAKGLEGQPLQWVNKEQLNQYKMPAANQPIINAVQLPSEYLITPQKKDNLLCFIENNLKKGIKLVQFRQPHCDFKKILEVVDLCHDYQAKLLINEDIKLAQKVKADGIHLKAAQLFEYKKIPLELIAASCHNLKELNQAQKIAHFALLSPIKKTTSHPLAKSLGFKVFENWVKQINMPVYGLGGLLLTEKKQIWQRGGQGIAGISCFL